jgi:DNA invertase Pin-like site-specific DNA recombinase
MSDRLCLYVRPHPTATVAQQLATLTCWAEGMSHQIVATYTEAERKRGPDHRREASRMLAGVPRGRWDRVASISLLALCRSVQHADSILAQCAASNVAVSVLLEGIDTNTDDGRTATAFALAAQLDHQLHTERGVVGVRTRTGAGFSVGGPRILATTEARIISLLRANVSPDRIMRMVRCGKSTVLRVRDELKLATP